MGDINWAVLGTGVIANEMAVALKKNGKNIRKFLKIYKQPLRCVMILLNN